jgi:hypothetical protein
MKAQPSKTDLAPYPELSHVHRYVIKTILDSSSKTNHDGDVVLFGLFQIEAFQKE